MANIQRRMTVTAVVGGVRVGSEAPIVVQSMTNTDTADIPRLYNKYGTSPRRVRTGARHREQRRGGRGRSPHRRATRQAGLRVPIIGDFHYNGHLLLTKYPECARDLAKYRINPGNASIGRTGDSNFRTMIEVAVKYQKPVRIGVNWGSLDQVLLTRMMDENSRLDEPKDAREVTMGSNGSERAELGGPGAAIWPACRPDHSEREGKWRAGFDRCLPCLGSTL